MRIPNVLTIAGSDSSGGAGIQADLKTFSALGVYGASVITALTVQNTNGVFAMHVPSESFVLAQMDAIFQDIRIDAVKIGMLANAKIIAAVASGLQRWKPKNVVLDTVMLSKNGYTLLDEKACIAMRETLLSLTTIVTPNLPEAAALLRMPCASSEYGMVHQGKALLAYGAKAVLMKGGHLKSVDSPDWLITKYDVTRIHGSRIHFREYHGTGCTLSSAIAALLPSTSNMKTAIINAKTYLMKSMHASRKLDVGKGIIPVHHFHSWW